MKEKDLLCPSAVPKNNSIIFGAINENGKVNYLKTPLKVNTVFLDEVSKTIAPDKKFRFASKCINASCSHWDSKDSLCSLSSKINTKLQQEPLDKLNFCLIRKDCRWFAQEGNIACANCSFVKRSYL